MSAIEEFTRTQEITSATFEDIGEPLGLYGKGGRLAVTVVSDAGSSALSGFQVQGRSHSSGPWMDLLEGDDFSGAGPLYFCTTQKPTDLDAGEKSMFVIDALRLESVKFQAKVAAGAAAITLYGIGG